MVLYFDITRTWDTADTVCVYDVKDDKTAVLLGTYNNNLRPPATIQVMLMAIIIY